LSFFNELKSGASVPMPVRAPTIGRRETEGYVCVPETPKGVRYCLGRVYQALTKGGRLASTRVFALSLALANEVGGVPGFHEGLTDAEYSEFREWLVHWLDEGRAAAKLRTPPKE
jgi:hypothetical protein